MNTVTKHLKLIPGSRNKQDVANYFVCVGTIGHLDLRLHFNMHRFMFAIHVN